MYWSSTSNQYTSIEPNFVDPNYDGCSRGTAKQFALRTAAAGNMTRDHRGYMYGYNYDNGLTSVKNPSSATLSTFVYDALGRRIKRSKLPGDPNAERYYVYSGQNVVEEYDGQSTRLRYFVHGPTYIDERVVMHDEEVDQDYVYLMKDLYTVAGLVDFKGWPVESYDYDAYGQARMSRHAAFPYTFDYDGDGDVDDDDLAVFQSHDDNGAGSPPSGTAGWRSDYDCDGDVDGGDYITFQFAYYGFTTEGMSTGNLASSRIENPYYFTGRRLDIYEIHDANTPTNFTDDYAGLALYYYRARTMDPVLGRFLQRDPTRYLDGMSPYQYAQSQPLRKVDPSGLSVKIFFNCTLAYSTVTGFGDCNKDCVYSCTEVKRTHTGAGGVIDDADLPRPRVTTEMKTVYGDRTCRYTCGYFGTPATCKGSYSTAHDYIDHSTSRNCSRSGCVASCRQVHSTVTTACNLLPVGRAACKAAADLALGNCTGSCNAWCQNP